MVTGVFSFDREGMTGEIRVSQKRGSEKRAIYFKSSPISKKISLQVFRCLARVCKQGIGYFREEKRNLHQTAFLSFFFGGGDR